MDEAGRLAPEAKIVLFEGDILRRNIPGGRSISEILELGEIESVTAWEDGPAVMLMFVPRQYLHRLDNDDFYRDEWMKTYFACYFTLEEGRWKFGPYNFCYAATDGPFPGEIG